MLESYNPKQMKRKRKLVRLFLALLAIIVMIVGYTAYSIWTFGQKSELIHADAAIVLGAATDGEEPSPVLKGRIDHAVRLYNGGYVNQIIFTGGSGDKGAISEAESSQKYALKQGVAAEDIIIEITSTITEENLQNAKIAAAEVGVSSFLLVSDPLHMKRAMLLARDLDMNVHASPTTTSAYRSMRTKLPFLAREVFFYIGYRLVSPFRSL
ncbi:YdcF family protein [Paenibacillus sp. EC2-1]|uniref:YdcF family protein n=1 Tax=Paenibacillus sp. EC2-1 TaxID=3388665 RepID=UPI003BEEC55A